MLCFYILCSKVDSALYGQPAEYPFWIVNLVGDWELWCNIHFYEEVNKTEELGAAVTAWDSYPCEWLLWLRPHNPGGSVCLSVCRLFHSDCLSSWTLGEHAWRHPASTRESFWNSGAEYCCMRTSGRSCFVHRFGFWGVKKKNTRKMLPCNWLSWAIMMTNPTWADQWSWFLLTAAAGWRTRQ